MSTLSLRKIKHDSAIVDNITLGSNGHVGIGTDPVDSFNFGKALDISSTSGAFVYLRDSDATNGVGGIGYSGTDVYISNKANGNIKFLCNTDATLRMNIDASGRVTMPYQPAFSVYRSNTLSGSQTPVIFDQIRVNRGSHYSTSTGRFTAPVSGVYFFSVTNNMLGSSGADGLIRKNGANIIGVEFDVVSSGQWLGLTACTVIDLAANDYVDYIVGNASSSVEGNPWNNFSGYLIG